MVQSSKVSFLNLYKVKSSPAATKLLPGPAATGSDCYRVRLLPGPSAAKAVCYRGRPVLYLSLYQANFLLSFRLQAITDSGTIIIVKKIDLIIHFGKFYSSVTTGLGSSQTRQRPDPEAAGPGSGSCQSFLLTKLIIFKPSFRLNSFKQFKYYSRSS